MKRPSQSRPLVIDRQLSLLLHGSFPYDLCIYCFLPKAAHEDPETNTNPICSRMAEVEYTSVDDIRRWLAEILEGQLREELRALQNRVR